MGALILGNKCNVNVVHLLGVLLTSMTFYSTGKSG